MSCSIQQAMKDRWATTASSYGIFDIPSTDGADNRFFQDGRAPNMPQPPYVVLEDLGGTAPTRTNEATFDARSFQLRVYAPSRQSIDLILPAVRKIFDCGIGGWHPVTDEGVIRDISSSRGARSRQWDGNWLGVVALVARVSVPRS